MSRQVYIEKEIQQPIRVDERLFPIQRQPPIYIDRIIEMDWYSYDQLRETPLKDYHFFKDFLPDTLCDGNGAPHCLLVLREYGDEGLVIHSGGNGYARYVARLPDARQLVTEHELQLEEICPSQTPTM